MERDQISDPTVWVEQHGDYLFGYALFRLRDADLAESLLQETFLAALRGYKTFANRSSERTWLVSILKHKIPLLAGAESKHDLPRCRDQKGRKRKHHISAAGVPKHDIGDL